MQTLNELNLLAPNALIVCETDQNAKLADVTGFRLVEKKGLWHHRNYDLSIR